MGFPVCVCVLVLVRLGQRKRERKVFDLWTQPNPSHPNVFSASILYLFSRPLTDGGKNTDAAAVRKKKNAHMLKHTLTMMHTFTPETERTSMANITILSSERVTALLTHIGVVHWVTSITSVISLQGEKDGL